MKKKIAYLEHISQSTGMDTFDWVKAVYDYYKNEGHKFELYISKDRQQEILEDLTRYYGDARWNLSEFLQIANIFLHITKNKEKLIIFYV